MTTKKKKTTEKPKSSVTENSKYPGKFSSLSIEKVGGFWSCVVYDIEDGVVVDRRVSEPCIKAVAIEQFKIEAVNRFMV